MNWQNDDPPMTSEQPSRKSNRHLANEEKTISIMVGMYCRDHHVTVAGELCRSCRELREYARRRLLRCPFQQDKPTCANCTVHCYNKDMRERIRKVMRYSGPKMMFRHPVLALRHVLAGWRKQKNNRKSR